MNIGIVGGGFVGNATALLTCKDIHVNVYDLDPAKCSPKGTILSDLSNADLVFVCVPTPTYSTGECNTNIVEKCIRTLKASGINRIVLRSTVPPGTSEALDVSFMPEFLTERNWRQDFVQCSQWVFGAKNEEEKAIFQRIMSIAKENGIISHDTILFTGRKEAELIKYSRNNFLALKISYFNELYSICKAANIDYEMVRQGCGGDLRIGLTHTGVPGYDGHFGFGGTCLPKDTSSLLHYITHTVGQPSYIIDAMVRRNTLVDRPEHDWESDPRAFTVKNLITPPL